MKLCTLTALLFALYAVVISLALFFRPVDPFTTTDWREAKAYEKKCPNHALVVYDRLERRYEVTCTE